jgi:hypothetical protein
MRAMFLKSFESLVNTGKGDEVSNTGEAGGKFGSMSDEV